MNNNFSIKQSMSQEQLSVLNSEMENQRKSTGVYYLLWFFLGNIGIHRMVLGDVGYGIAMLFLNWATFGVWWIIDAFLLAGRVEKKNTEIENNVIYNIKMSERRDDRAPTENSEQYQY